ncbi:hypothetical protein LTR60_006401 [Cryomyces antarcticus]|nr:hypothetical protein LTR60_006401 [Cryomyces antarcticus]
MPGPTRPKHTVYDMHGIEGDLESLVSKVRNLDKQYAAEVDADNSAELEEGDSDAGDPPHKGCRFLRVPLHPYSTHRTEDTHSMYFEVSAEEDAESPYAPIRRIRPCWPTRAVGPTASFPASSTEPPRPTQCYNTCAASLCRSKRPDMEQLLNLS